MGGVQNSGEVGMVAVSWGFGGVTVCAQRLGLFCLAPEAWLLGKGPPPPSRRPSHELPGSARPMWKLHPSAQAARPLGNVMRLLKWGPGPGGKRGPPPNRAGCGRSFPEIQPGSADGDWLTRFGLESQAPRGWSGACCLGRGHQGWRADKSVVGVRSPSSQPVWTSSSPPCYKGIN